VIALDPETGTERWSDDPHVDLSVRHSEVTSRGVSTWVDPDREARAPCHRRIFVATIDARLIAADPAQHAWHGESAAHPGGANAWAVMSADSERHLVFVPTSSPSPDFYGGERGGSNVYANAVVALHLRRAMRLSLSRCREPN
jgi:glucose dehydrogenase